MDTYISEQQLAGSMEDIQYALWFEHALRSLESQLHNTDNSEVIALQMLVAAVEFYDGDRCGGGSGSGGRRMDAVVVV